MQIHEITSRKKLNEAGVLGTLANQFVSSTLGVNPSSGTDDPQAQAQAAMKINTQLAGQLGQQLNKVWDQVLENFMATADRKGTDGMRLTNIKLAVPADLAKLKQELNQIIVDTAKVGKSLDEWVSSFSAADDPAIYNQVKLIADNIKQTADAIWKTTVDSVDKTGQARAQAFSNLGTSIAQIQNINTFHKQDKSGKPTEPGERRTSRIKYDERTGKFTYDNRPYDDTNPAHRAAMADFNKNKPA